MHIMITADRLQNVNNDYSHSEQKGSVKKKRKQSEHF